MVKYIFPSPFDKNPFQFSFLMKEADNNPCLFFDSTLWDPVIFLFQLVLKHMDFQGFPGAGTAHQNTYLSCRPKVCKVPWQFTSQTAIE